MRAIGYFQTDDAGEDSLADMQRAFDEYCELNMHQSFMTFESDGRDETQKDSVYRQMVEYMNNSRSEFLVVIPSARHLGSSLESVARSIVELDGLGAKITCFDEEFPDPLQNAFQTLGIKGVSRTRSHRIKESMRARALQGQALGRPLYGYRIGPDGNLAVLRDEAAVVELIYRLYTSDGLGLRLIAQHLNERFIHTRRGGNWNVVSIRDILRNPGYTGTSTRFGMRRPRAHEAIISAELFRMAQNQTKARRPIGRVVNAEPFLLSGSIFCDYCGSKMMGVTRRQTWKRKSGDRVSGIYRYYQCQSRNNQSVCEYHTWRASLLESTVLSQLRYELKAGASKARDNFPQQEKTRALKNSAIENAERRFIQAMKRVSSGTIHIKSLGEYLKDLDAARCEALRSGRVEDIEATLDNWESVDLGARRAFLAEHVVRIAVRDDKIDIVV